MSFGGAPGLALVVVKGVHREVIIFYREQAQFKSPDLMSHFFLGLGFYYTNEGLIPKGHALFLHQEDGSHFQYLLHVSPSHLPPECPLNLEILY